MSTCLCLDLPDEAATLRFGAELARTLSPGLKLWLHGALGTGKTTLTRGLLRGLGFAGRVKSPTYTLVELYKFPRFNLYHFDLYRFADPNEWAEAGFRDYFDTSGVCLVEWPEKGGDLLPAPDLAVFLDFSEDAQGRRLRIEAYTEAGRACVARLNASPA